MPSCQYWYDITDDCNPCLYVMGLLDSTCGLCYTNSVGSSNTTQQEGAMFKGFDHLPTYVKAIIFAAEASQEKQDNGEKGQYGLAHRTTDSENAVMYLCNLLASKDADIADLKAELKSTLAAYNAMLRESNESPF